MKSLSASEVNQFEDEFRKLCDRLDVMACFVLVSGEDQLGARLMIGGFEPIQSFVSARVAGATVEAMLMDDNRGSQH